MTNSKATKKALFMSVISLLLCFTMLMGATFAWFTDTVKSSSNRIVAGNLKVDLVMDKLDGKGYVSIAEPENEAGRGDIFSEATGNGINWEPGKTEVVYLGVRNNGSLALKYNILLNIVDEGLIGSLEYAIIDQVTSETKYSDWEAVKAAAGEQTGDLPKGQVVAAQGGVLDEIAYDSTKTGETDYFVLAIHMKEEAGNEYQEKGVKIDVQVLATQKDAEEDSFGPEYDKNADFDGQISTVDALKAAAAKGGTYQVMSDLALTEYVSVPEGVTLELDLGGKTLSAENGNVIRNKGNLTITNGTLEGTTTYTINNESTSGSVTVKDVKSVNGGFFNAGSMEVINCEITNTASGKHALVNSGDASTNLVVNGGTYSTTATNALLYAYSGSIEVNDGSFTQIGSSYMIDGSGITINGGTFTDDDGIAVRGSNMTIAGGTFNFDPEIWLADGYAATENADGTWTVSKKIVPDGATLVSEGLYQDAGGNYLITNATGLATMGTMVADEAAHDDDGTWILYADIDMTGVNWTPINGFYGVFDGNGKTISNLTVNTDDAAGLFGKNSDSLGADSLVTKPVIKNLILTNANVTGNEKVGVVAAGMGYAAIENVTVTGATVNGNKYVGGIAGHAYTNGGITITDCTVTDSTIKADNDNPNGKVGGIGGYIALGTIKNNTVEDCTISGPECVGGIIGRGGSGDGTVAVVVGNTVSGNTVTGTETATVGDVIGDKLNVKENE